MSSLTSPHQTPDYLFLQSQPDILHPLNFSTFSPLIDPSTHFYFKRLLPKFCSAPALLSRSVLSLTRLLLPLAGVWVLLRLSVGTSSPARALHVHACQTSVLVFIIFSQYSSMDIVLQSYGFKSQLYTKYSHRDHLKSRSPT